MAIPSGTAISSEIAEVTTVPKIRLPAPNTLAWATPAELAGFHVECQRNPSPKVEIDELAPSISL